MDCPVCNGNGEIEVRVPKEQKRGSFCANSYPTFVRFDENGEEIVLETCHRCNGTGHLETA
jgi:DnaJ-class molecular chaperone